MATKHKLHITIDPKTGVDQVLRTQETKFQALADEFNRIAPQGEKVLSVPKDPQKRKKLAKKMEHFITAHDESQRAPST